AADRQPAAREAARRHGDRPARRAGADGGRIPVAHPDEWRLRAAQLPLAAGRAPRAGLDGGHAPGLAVADAGRLLGVDAVRGPAALRGLAVTAPPGLRGVARR